MKKFLYVLSLAMFPILLTRAQAPEKQNFQKAIDSIKTVLDTATDDTNKVKLYCRLSEKYLQINPGEMLRYGKSGMELSDKLHWKLGVAWSHFCIAGGFSGKSEYDSAIEHYTIAHKMFKDLNQMQRAVSALATLGYQYIQQNRFPIAQQCELDALQEYDAMHDELGEATCYRYIGLIFFSQKDYVKAEDYFQRALKNYSNLNRKNEMAQVLSNLARCYMCQQKYMEALDNLNRARTISEQVGNTAALMNHLVNIGEVYKMKGDYATAIEYNQKTLQLATDYGNKKMKGTCLGNTGEIYLRMAKDTIHRPTEQFKQENLVKSIDLLSQAIAIEKEVKVWDAVIEYSEELTTAYKLKGDYKKAMELTDEYLIIRDTVFSAKNIAQVNAAEKKYLLDLKNKEIEIQQLELIKKKHATVFYSIALVLLAIVIIISLRNNNEQKKLNEKISELVNEQEKVIQKRTAELALSNKTLVELIQYAAHNLREPLTRITGAMSIKEDLSEEEFNDDIWPQMVKASTDLDKIIIDVINRADQTINSMQQ
ncbi:MAG: tetratricopeptide repeat protein [Chitinophagia bacterium]|nr:tetratricopeptide repeat protein [Chitinophagia bacterium]